MYCIDDPVIFMTNHRIVVGAESIFACKDYVIFYREDVPVYSYRSKLIIVRSQDNSDCVLLLPSDAILVSFLAGGL
jgi:hypothetical protein